jgi:HNH endonuclease
MGMRHVGNNMTSLLDDPRLPQRFWDKITPEPNSGCWIWTAAVNRRGYGQVRMDNKICSSHRLAYHTLISPVPIDIQLHHLCEIESCCNPLHLEPVTAKEHANKPSHIARTILQLKKVNHLPGAIASGKLRAKLTSKPILCSNGSRFSSIHTAGKCLNLSISHICECLHGKRKTCGGFTWNWSN